MLCESDASSPYGLLGGSLIRVDAGKNLDALNDWAKIDEKDFAGAAGKTAELEGGYPNIDSAATGHETLSANDQRDRSLRLPYETPGQGPEATQATNGPQGRLDKNQNSPGRE